MTKPNTNFLFYGGALLSGPEAAAISKFGIVVLSAGTNFEANRDALKAANPDCRVLVYLNYTDASGSNGAVPISWLQQISVEGWLLKQTAAAVATSPLLTYYTSGKGLTFDVNKTKVGGTSGLRPGPWYVANVVPSLMVSDTTDGFFLDQAGLGPQANIASVVEVARSGTSTATTGASLIADSTKSATWTTNSEQNRMVRMTSGAAAGRVNWVASNTTTALTLKFPFSPAPSSGDTYEMYTYSTALLPTSTVLADYTEAAAPVNLDSIAWRIAMASAQREMLDALVTAYPGKTVIVNDGRGYDCKEIRGVDRTAVGVFAEGVLNTGYEIGFTSTVTQVQCMTRRLAPHCVVEAQPTNSTSWAQGRYALVAALMADAYVCLAAAGDLSTTTTMWLDEYDVDLGEPASDTTRNADGTWSREYTQAYIVANPTAGSIVITVPTGFRRILASDYANQDPTLNDGSTDHVTLLTKTAVMFVRV